MESMLLIVTVVALSLGAVMSFVAWRLLRDTRARSAARVEALQALAQGDAAEIAPARVSRIAEVQSDEDGDAEPQWDLTLRPREAAVPATAPGFAERMALRTLPPAGSARAVARPAANARAEIRQLEPAYDLVSTPALFGVDVVPAAPSRRWLVVVALIGVTVLGGAAAYSLRAWDVLGAVTNASAAPRDIPALELLSLRHATDDAGNFTVIGLVQNPQSGHALRGVVAVIYLFDQHGRFLSSGRAAIDVPSFQPGDESPFVVKVPAMSGVTRYRVGFRYTDGGVVAHVDKRGQLPDGTMENAIEPAQQPPSLPAPFGPKRSEG